MPDLFKSKVGNTCRIAVVVGSTCVQAATCSFMSLSFLRQRLVLSQLYSLFGSTISAIMASNLRSGDRNIYLIGSERHQITGCKLPSNRQVLSVLFYNLHEVNLSIRESANLVVRECLIFWERARIPTRATPHCVEKIMKMNNYWRNLQKSACRRSETQEENERNFISDLNNLFDIAHANALEIIKIVEDRKFLLSQREPGRRGCLMGIDVKLAKREERVLLRVIEQENRLTKAHHSSEIDDNFMDSSEESSSTEDISDQPGPSSNIAQSSLQENINAQIELRMGIRSAVFILEAVAESLGHNIDEFAINRNTIQRYREDFRKTKATRIKKLFQENEPSFVCVHWDSKLLPALNVRDLKSERLPIIVTYKDEEKLLGVPKLENSSGKEQAMAVWNVLKDWGLEDKAQILCFDTISWNTGRVNGEITFLELYADREMTYFPCRVNIYELVLRNVFEYELNEVTSSPDVAFFKKIREKWNNLEKENYMDGYKYLNAICS
ncbi:hypothetical protein AVEN_262775-1 [Araneus ventricosus]|uniref:Uncharacterized protein n=1 Tax=Araneus ventricosus TaxID=182803 RepID=A0A4Y2VX42_ARAVE|nr:hypothetical protein AVEN_262775-1 [Araneus ventricosus]